MSGKPNVTSETALVPARAFLRSLNLLLKSAQLYGFQHRRTSAQLEDVWNGLRGVWQGGSAEDFTVGTAGPVLVVNGTRLEANPAEQGFARMLEAAGLTSVQFSPRITREEFFSFLRTFAEAGGKPGVLAGMLRAALAESRVETIRVNELRFVAQDPNAPDAETSLAAQLAVGTLPAEAGQLQEWLNDPVKLLQLMASSAARGTQPGPELASLGTGASQGTGEPLDEAELLRLLRLLAGIGQAGQARGAAGSPVPFTEELRNLPAPAQEMLRRVLAGIAEKAPPRPEAPLLVQLAEQLAIRFALERYERGDIRVDSVRQLLQKMNQEIQSLRKILRASEERMAQAGLAVEDHIEILDRQFWAGVPTSGKLTVLLSPDAWCIPPRNIRQFLEELGGKGDAKTAREILLNFAQCVRSAESEARRKATRGLQELADLYAASDPAALDAAFQEASEQLEQERDPELQSLLAAAVARLGQEAVSRRHYRAMVDLLGLLDRTAKQRHAWAQGWRLRVEKEVPEIIEEALRAPQVPEGLAELLQAVPEVAAEQLAGRLVRCTRRRERERVVLLAEQAGPRGVEYLHGIVGSRPISESIHAVGLLSRLDPSALAEILPGRLRNAGRANDDAALRQLAIAAAPERGRLLTEVLDLLDPLVLPRAIEEIGLCRDPVATQRLLRLAEGHLPASGHPYLGLKAIEALGQIGAVEAASLLQALVESKQVLGWAYPRELRIVAAQALAKLDQGWAQEFLPRSGLEAAELALGPVEPGVESSVVRPRFYARVRPVRPLGATLVTPEGRYPATARVLSLGGGLVACEHPLPLVVEANLRIQSGLRPIAATVIARSQGAQQAAFEIVDIELEERSKLRRLLAGLAGPSGAPDPGSPAEPAH